MATYTDTDTIHEAWGVSATDVKPGVLLWAAETAYEFINSCLDGHYGVPFTTVPTLIVKISDLLTKDLATAIKNTHGRPLRKKDLKAVFTGTLVTEWLDALAMGTKEIPDVARSTGLASHAAYDPRQGYTAIFDVDSVYKHLPDTDLVNALDDERD